MPITLAVASPAPPRRSLCSHTYEIPRVRELPRRLEPVTADTFGGVVLRGTAPTRVRRGLP
jgi:hypothetical protein